MGESLAADSEPAEAVSSSDERDTTITISDKGDIILDVTFETSQDTLKRSRREAAAAARKLGPKAVTNGRQPRWEETVRVTYRVNLDVLKKQSHYFSNLLANPRFKEAKAIADAHGALTARGVPPSEARAEDLPWITITDDDEATQAAGREHAMEDVLLVIHGQPPKTTKITMSYVTTLAILADRFDCTAPVSRSLSTDLKFKWPATSARPFRDETTGKPTDTEQTLRQKVLVSWLLGQPIRFAQSTRELIIRGSRLWTPYQQDEPHEAAPNGGAATSNTTTSANNYSAAWWNLPDGIEEELQLRRDCILNTVASIQRHFLALYTSRARQCKLGYDSSPACDSFQLGQMLSFLLSRKLVFLADFSPASLDALPHLHAGQGQGQSGALATLDVDTELLAVLKQCPNYQVDRFHTNCGLRIRIDPILDYVRAMLSAGVVSLSWQGWKKDRAGTTWLSGVDDDGDAEGFQRNGGGFREGLRDDQKGRRVFAFTRAMANDQRLRYEGAMYADRVARRLFTADSWDWTPEIQ